VQNVVFPDGNIRKEEDPGKDPIFVMRDKVLSLFHSLVIQSGEWGTLVGGSGGIQTCHRGRPRILSRTMFKGWSNLFKRAENFLWVPDRQKVTPDFVIRRLFPCEILEDTFMGHSEGGGENMAALTQQP